MRIAHVSPLAESVPPRTYGGTERVVSWLVETMTGMGHDVTLFASADSVTSATLRPCSRVALRADPECRDPLAYDIRMMNRVLAEAHAFDVIHFHTNLLQFALFRGHRTPCVTTLHGRSDLPELKLFLDEFPEMPLVSVSGTQRLPLPDANWVGTVHHGVPETLFAQGQGKGGYLAFLGRFSPEKGTDAAIRIAQRAGLPLKLAAKVDRADAAYFESTIRPLLGLPGIDYVGEIGEHEKEEFLGNARALLFPICWPEPFGLVMIEAMACGTPVIAFPFGWVPEVIDEDRTGFIVPDENAAVQAIAALDRLDRTQIRRTFERRFSARRMASEYIQLYERLLADRRPRAAPRRLDDELENA